MSDAAFALANKTLRLEFDRGTGALVGLEAPETGWRILDRPHLGLAFRLLVPTRDFGDWHVAGRRNTNVLGDRQPLSALKIGADGRNAQFSWNTVETTEGEHLDIGVRLRVTLDERRVVFAMTIDNRSPHVVENVYVPYLGDVQPPGGAAWVKAFSKSDYAQAGEWDMWPVYDELTASFSVDHPAQVGPWSVASCSPANPFMLLRTTDQGLYIGPAGRSTDLIAWHTELRPGHESWLDRRVPRTRQIGGHDVAIRFAPVQLPNIQPGETRDLIPIALEAYRGTWHAGVDIYKRWRDAWMTLPELPAWTREPHAWQQVQVNSAEDRFAVRSYRDLVEVGASAAHNGVRAIQLTGWNDGGQDQGNPSHDTDPRLGRREDLADAIRTVQAMGVKVILFSKFTWASSSTLRARPELRRLAILDAYGEPYRHGGYAYDTVTALLGINREPLVPMCFLAEDWLRVCEAEFEKILELGADGTLYDECEHHNPALQCFAVDHGHAPGASVYGNDNELIRRFRARSEAVAPGFLYAGEDLYDWQYAVYDHSYIRSEYVRFNPLLRYLHPHGSIMTAVLGFNDRNQVNQALLYRYVLSYEPFGFKGRLEDFPDTVAYGRQMDALRTELRDWFWDGDFRDTLGATVLVGGQAHHPYSVYRAASSGRPGLVIANYDPDTTIEVDIAVDDGSVPTRWRLVDDDRWHATTDSVRIPPQSAAVLVD
jgi:hypothetical protein